MLYDFLREMKILVRAKPKSKKEFVKKIDATNFIVAVKEPPIDGKANEAIVKAIGEYLHVPPSSIFIVSGKTTKNKIIEVPLTIAQLEKIGESNTQLKMIE